MSTATYVPATPTDEIMRMLIRAKSFLEHARLHSHLDTEFDIMISLHNLDNSIEYMLRIIITHLDIEHLTNQTLDTSELSKLIGPIEKFVSENDMPRLPLVREIKIIRELRNLVQHAGILPISDVSMQMTIGSNFFERCLGKYFGLKADELRYSRLIVNPRVKSQLEEAEKNLVDQKHLEAIVNSRNAFEYARIFVLDRAFLRYSIVEVQKEVGNDHPELIRYLDELYQRVELDGYKTDLAQYGKFEDYIGHIPVEHCAEDQHNAIMQRDWLKEDASFCYNITVETIFKWQNMKRGRLYELDEGFLELMKSTERIERLDSVDLIDLFADQGCYYLSDSTGRLFYTDRATAAFIRDNIRVGETHSLQSTTLTDGIETYNHTSEISIEYVNVRLVLNDYPAWEVVLWYSEKDEQPIPPL